MVSINVKSDPPSNCSVGQPHLMVTPPSQPFKSIESLSDNHKYQPRHAPESDTPFPVLNTEVKSLEKTFLKRQEIYADSDFGSRAHAGTPFTSDLPKMETPDEPVGDDKAHALEANCENALLLHHTYPLSFGQARFSLSNSVNSYAGTGSTASLSTGRQSPQSFIHSTRGSYDQRNHRYSVESSESEELRRVNDPPSRLPQSSLEYIAEPDNEHSCANSLTSSSISDIQGESFNSDRPISSALDQSKSLERESHPSDSYMPSPTEPDPEIAALYQDHSVILSQSTNHSDNELESASFSPLHGHKLITDTCDEHASNNLSPELMKHTLLIPDQSPTKSSMSDLTQVSTPSPRSKAHTLPLGHPGIASMKPSMYELGSNIGSLGNKARLNRPPAFDFIHILHAPTSADRRRLFDEAREKEANYDSGIQAWLEQNISKIPADMVLQSSGLQTSKAAPSTPTRKLSVARLTSSARKMTMPKVASKVGERSSNAAKGFFSKGRKLMKSSK